MKKLDFVVIGVVVMLSLLPLVLMRGGQADAVAVRVHGETVYRGPLSRDAVVEAGAGNTVTVQGGVVTMTRANCPDGLCLSGHATQSHPLVCLPNEVVVTVEKEAAELDGVTY